MYEVCLQIHECHPQVDTIKKMHVSPPNICFLITYFGSAIIKGDTGNGKILCIWRDNHVGMYIVPYFKYSGIIFSWRTSVPYPHTRAVFSAYEYEKNSPLFSIDMKKHDAVGVIVLVMCS